MTVTTDARVDSIVDGKYVAWPRMPAAMRYRPGGRFPRRYRPSAFVRTDAVGGGAVTICNDDLGALVVESLRKCTPDAISGTGDNRHLSRQIHCCDVTHRFTQSWHPCDMVRP